MIQRSPCEYYLKYLIVHPDNLSNDQIREIVVGQQLDFIGMPYLSRLRAACVAPVPFYPYDTSHKRTQRFLIKEGIRGMFLPDEHMRQANKFLDMPRAKETIESSLVTGSAPVWVAALLRRAGIPASSQSIERYQHFFFNASLVDSMELRALLCMRTMMDSSSDPDEKKQSAAMAKVEYSDPRRIAANISVAPIAGIINQVRLGLMPKNVELAKLVAATRALAVGRAMDQLVRGGKADAVRDLTTAANTMNELLAALGSPEEELQESLYALSLETDDRDIPHINQLSDGQHTVDLQPEALKQDVPD